MICQIKQHGVREQGAERAEGDGGGAHPHLSLLLVQHAPHSTIRIGELTPVAAMLLGLVLFKACHISWKKEQKQVFFQPKKNIFFTIFSKFVLILMWFDVERKLTNTFQYPSENIALQGIFLLKV